MGRAVASDQEAAREPDERRPRARRKPAAGALDRNSSLLRATPAPKTPGQAGNFLKTLRGLFRWAVRASTSTPTRRPASRFPSNWRPMAYLDGRRNGRLRGSLACRHAGAPGLRRFGLDGTTARRRFTRRAGACPGRRDYDRDREDRRVVILPILKPLADTLRHRRRALRRSLPAATGASSRKGSAIGSRTSARLLAYRVRPWATQSAQCEGRRARPLRMLSLTPYSAGPAAACRPSTHAKRVAKSWPRRLFPRLGISS